MGTFLSKLLFPNAQTPAATPPAQSGPVRPLMLPRLLATFNNIGAFLGRSNANWQKDIYISGEGSLFEQMGLDGGTPSWIPCDFLPLGPSKTGRSKLPLPDNFTLLAFFASASVNTVGGFRVNVYDINRRMRMTERPVNFNAIAGTGRSPLFIGGDWGPSRYGAPYQFAPNNAQVMVTVVNLESQNNNIEFGLYGIQGGTPASS